MTIAERFWAKVSPEPNTGCWLWTGATVRGGYGVVKLGGRDIGAPRASLMIAGVDVPAGMCVLHRCDTPSCVNPQHLFVGTKSLNTADMRAKGRGKPGSGRWALSAEVVLEMRRAARAGVRHHEIAQRFRVSRSAVTRAITGKTWRHVPQPSFSPQ